MLSQTYAWRTTASPAPRFPACQAVGEPEGGERVFANFKQVMFMAQLLIRRTLWKL